MFSVLPHKMIGKLFEGGFTMQDRDIDEMIFAEEEYAVSQR